MVQAVAPGLVPEAAPAVAADKMSVSMAVYLRAAQTNFVCLYLS